MKRPRPIAAIEAELAFARPQDVSPDDEFPTLGRARATADGPTPETLERHLCRLHDLEDDSSFLPTLGIEGFAQLDLSGLTELQALLARVDASGTLVDADRAALRHALLWKPLSLGDGSTLRFLHLAGEGLILRQAGPNGLDVAPGTPVTAMNGHSAATAVHADQDVDGTPIRQILGGAGPWLFRHQSPLHENRRSPLFLLNLWIPLQQITRPLVLMDHSSLDRVAHQLRYGLPVAGFLERRPDRRVNDIWSFLHHPSQRWYFSSRLGPETAYVFQTLSTPHGATVLPGEDAAEQRFLRLKEAADAITRGDRAGLAAALGSEPDPPPSLGATGPLRQAIDDMDDLLETGRAQRIGLCGTPAGMAWAAQARTTAARVVRRSVELRGVAWVTPGRQPQLQGSVELCEA